MNTTAGESVPPFISNDPNTIQTGERDPELPLHEFWPRSRTPEEDTDTYQRRMWHALETASRDLSPQDFLQLYGHLGDGNLAQLLENPDAITAKQAPAWKAFIKAKVQLLAPYRDANGDISTDNSKWQTYLERRYVMARTVEYWDAEALREVAQGAPYSNTFTLDAIWQKGIGRTLRGLYTDLYQKEGLSGSKIAEMCRFISTVRPDAVGYPLLDMASYAKQVEEYEVAWQRYSEQTAQLLEKLQKNSLTEDSKLQEAELAAEAIRHQRMLQERYDVVEVLPFIEGMALYNDLLSDIYESMGCAVFAEEFRTGIPAQKPKIPSTPTESGITLGQTAAMHFNDVTEKRPALPKHLSKKAKVTQERP
jgi:hypothetical protein